MKDELGNTIVDLVTDGAELSLDLATESELIEAIPIFGTIVKAAKASISIRERIFLKRIGTFLGNLTDVDPKLFSDFSERLDSDSEKEKFGERLVTLIEQSDEKQKAGMIGILFHRLLKGEITKDQFDHLGFCITRIYLFDLFSLSHSLENSNILDNSLGASLAAYRLADSKFQRLNGPQPEDSEITGTVYSMNSWGRLVAETVRQYTEDSIRRKAQSK